MRPKLLKNVLRGGRVTVGVSCGIIAGRLVVNQLTKRTEKEARKFEQFGGEPPAHLQKRLRVMRLARAIFYAL